MDIGESFGSPLGRTVSLGDLIGILLSGAITLAGVILLFLFIGGGVMVISSAGSNNAQGAAQGKQAITWALIGFAVVFTAYWIIRIIELITGNSFLTNPGDLFLSLPPTCDPGQGPC